MICMRRLLEACEANQPWRLEIGPSFPAKVESRCFGGDYYYKCSTFVQKK